MLSALILFCLVATITPGPNNMMLLSSGATFGLRRTVPHIIGISGGCTVMVLILGWGLGGLAKTLPSFYTALHIASTLYLIWLAWRIATSAGPGGSGRRGKPFSMLDAAIFQWINPKAWAMVLGAVANFANPVSMMEDVLLIAGILMLVGLPCITLWAGAGSMLQQYLQNPVALRLFNFSMAALLILSILPGLGEIVSGKSPS